ncbi:MAG: pyridoxamine 5'-phosphate oxidase [Acidimicrobiia bacterium]
MSEDRIRDRRVQYESPGLERHDLDGDPMAQWHVWHSAAFDAGLAEPNAMLLSTVDVHGHPDARTVLIRSADRHGFTFFTNYESAKSHQMTARPVAAATFLWLEHHRQVRVRGTVERVSDLESDEYFATRPRASQIGAWASPQSEVLRDRHELMELVTDYDRKFHDGPVPRPPHWGGWRLVPHEWEFWQGRPSRLHDRFRYRPDGHAWHIDRLAP